MATKLRIMIVSPSKTPLTPEDPQLIVSRRVAEETIKEAMSGSGTQRFRIATKDDETRERLFNSAMLACQKEGMLAVAVSSQEELENLLSFINDLT